MSQSASPLRLQVVVSPTVDLSIGGTFSPTTATIILGPTEAVLVDTLFGPADVERLAETIEASGRALTTIYITHAHFDHYSGLEVLLGRFPHARAVTLPGTAELIHQTHEPEGALAASWLPGKTLATSVLPDALDGDELTVDGHELRPIEVGQGDSPHSTVLHVPSIDAVVAGDVVYNGVHQMLGVSGPEEWTLWMDSIGKIASLRPRTVVAGHKRAELPDDDLDAILGGSKDYIAAFIEALADANDAESIVAVMSERFPDRVNRATLEFSAAAAIERKRQGAGSDL